MPLTPGTRLGPYEIVAPLGAGGMGEVYRARDTRLARDVAVKVLPQHLSASAEVRARFEREAKTVSSLNHPNICTLFDVGRAPGEAGSGETDFLVMELIEGETLASRLQRGALPSADSIRIGAQIADALDRAHRAGVVHRDLKPGNVMLTKSGAKLMDFGLARATPGGGAPGGAAPQASAPVRGSLPGMAALSQSPTIAAPLTAEGSIVGTFQYMSPEQLEGKEADGRSDIWALGCVLYEMASGRHAFAGESQASLIGTIMKDEPRPLIEIAPMSPPALDRAVRTCLAKDPDERWQSAGDVRRELQWISGGSHSAVSGVAAPRRKRGAALPGWIAAGTIAALAAVWTFGPWSAHRTPVPLMRFSLPQPAKMFYDAPAEAELSPDGRAIVFAALDSSGVRHLCLRLLDNPEARVLPGTEHASLPFWSPDSRSIGFFSSAKLRKIALDGGAPVALCDAPDARGGSWSRDGIILFVPGNQGPIARVSANGGEPVAVTKVNMARQEKGHRYPQFLPDGRHFLYVAIGNGELQTTYAASVSGGDPVEVCRGGTEARYAEPGWILYLDSSPNSPQRRLLARRFDPGRLRVTGDAQLVLDDVNANNFGYSNISTSDRGTLVVQHWAAPHTRLDWRDRTGRVIGNAVPDLDTQGSSLSPDGTRLAYAANAPLDLFVLDLSTHVSKRLTFENRLVANMVWSNDGRRIAFSRAVGSFGWEARVKDAEGAGPDSLVYHASGLFTFPQSWSRDGRWLVMVCSDTLGNYDLWRAPMLGGGKPEPLPRTPAQEQSANLSPDGRWLGYVASQGGENELYVQSFPDGKAKYQVAATDVGGFAWAESGKELIVGSTDGTITSIQVSTTGGFQQGASQRLFQLPRGTFFEDLARGEQRFLIGTPLDASASSHLEVILGWQALLAKK